MKCTSVCSTCGSEKIVRISIKLFNDVEIIGSRDYLYCCEKCHGFNHLYLISQFDEKIKNLIIDNKNNFVNFGLEFRKKNGLVNFSKRKKTSAPKF